MTYGAEYKWLKNVFLVDIGAKKIPSPFRRVRGFQLGTQAKGFLVKKCFFRLLVQFRLLSDDRVQSHQ